MYHIKRQMNAEKNTCKCPNRRLCYIYSVIHKICEFSICVQCIQTKKPQKTILSFHQENDLCIHMYI